MLLSFDYRHVLFCKQVSVLPKGVSYLFWLVCRVFAVLRWLWEITRHLISPLLWIIWQHGCSAMNATCACACVFPMTFPQSHPPTGTIVSPYPIKTIAKTGIQTRACLCVCVCVCMKTHTQKPTYTDECTQIYQPVHTLGRERVISKSILLETKTEKKEWEPQNLHQCWLIVKDCQLLQPSIWPKGSSRIQLGAQ